MLKLRVSDEEIRSAYASMQQEDDSVTADRILCNPALRSEFLARILVELAEVEEATLRRLINLRKSNKLKDRSKP